MTGAVTPPAGIERDYPLARLTTVRTGGPADFFARPESEADLVALLAWARDAGIEVGVVGSGSNLLVADDGFRGLAIKLTGALTAIEREGTRLRCGGGARLPSVAAKAAGWGLAGLEFGVNIPGTAGGAVRMNANAYGGQLAAVLEWVEVATAAGTERRDPAAFEFTYRDSNLAAAEVVSRASFTLAPGDPEEIRATLASLRDRRRAAQPSGIKTFGSTFKNPDDERAAGRSAGQLLEAAGCAGLRRGGARFAAKHANFVENTGAATTADVLALMAAGRRRVKERFGVELEPEVRVLGKVEVPLVKRAGLALVALALVALVIYWVALRGSSDTTAAARPPHPVARIGDGERVVVVGDDGRLMGAASGEAKSELPLLPLKARPRGDRVRGHVLEQVEVLAAAPPPLRRYIAATGYGETGVDVEFGSGIEIRFGDDHEAARKWKAAAALLADPSLTLLSYVDVHSPTHPAVGGEEHELPPAS